MVDQIRYFEDYQIGQKGETFTRTVTEADIVNFAYLSTAFSREHVDRHHTANNAYGGRIAHGRLGCSLVSGMLSLTAPHTVARGIPGGYLWYFDVNYKGAIKLGDTIKINWNIAEKANDRTHQGYGLVKTAYQIINQDDAAVYDGVISILARKGLAGDARLQLKPDVPWEFKELAFNPQQAYYVEDLPQGYGGETEGRTVTETDLVNYAGLTGDYDPQYGDVEYARKSQFGERIVHGMLTFTIANGLRTNHWSRYYQPETRIAGHLRDWVTYLAPVKIGDTIRCRHKVTESRVSKSKPEMGIITFGMQVINQRDEVVQVGAVVNLLPTRQGLRR